MTTIAHAHVLLQALSQGFNAIPFNQVLGVSIDALDDKQTVLRFDMKHELVGNFLHGILHGGVIASVLDVAGGITVMASAIQKHPSKSIEELTSIAANLSTIDLHINYINPGKGDYFIAKSWMTKSGHTVSFTRMEMYNHQETLIAAASGTYLLKE